MKVILFAKENKEFDSFKDLFQHLSEKNIVVKEVTDGEIITDKESFKFAILDTVDTAARFVADVEGYRAELRTSIGLLKKQGINVPKEELDKLAKQLEFLNHKPAAKVEEDSVPQ